MLLCYRAHQACARMHAGKHGAPVLPRDTVDTSEPHDEELHILGGHTRIVSGKSTHSTPSTTTMHSPLISLESLYCLTTRGFTPEMLDKVHPVLLADLCSTKESEASPVPGMVGSWSQWQAPGSMHTCS